MPSIGLAPSGAMVMEDIDDLSLGRLTAAGLGSGLGLAAGSGASRSSGLVTLRIVVVATRV